MKVLEKGSAPWSCEVTCTGRGNGGEGCGARLLVEQSDLFFTREFEREGGGALCVTIECPECQTRTDIKVPERIRKQIPPCS